MVQRDFERRLTGLARALAPRRSAIERQFKRRLSARGFGPPERRALSAITLTALAGMLVHGGGLPAFFEQVEYSARRLAKLNLPQSRVALALGEFARAAGAAAAANGGQYVREQLEFAILLTVNRAYCEVRESEAQVFYDLARVELEASGVGALLRGAAAILRRFLRAVSCRIALGGSGTRRARYCEGPATRGDERRCWWIIPLRRETRVAGEIRLEFKAPYRWLPRELDLLSAVAERCLKAAEKAALVERVAGQAEKLRALAHHLTRVEEEERRRIGRELHDEAGQSLLLIRLRLEMLEQIAAGEVRSSAREIRELAEHTIRELRRILSALSPVVLQQFGLPAALRQLAARFQAVSPARIRVSLPRQAARLPAGAELALYRVAQECLNNAARHSGARNINIRLVSTDRLLKLCVSDDGRGIPAAARRNGFGLTGMAERLALLGGSLKIDSRPDRGAGIRATLPLKGAQQI